MPRLIASSSQAESLGVQVLALFRSVRKDDFAFVLQKYGLEHVEPDHWYSQQLTLDILKDIEDSRINEIDSMVSIGMAVIESVPGSPASVPLEEVLAGLNTMNHRMNRNIPREEGYIIQILGPSHAHVTNNTPYPDDLIFGMLWNLVRRRIPGSKFSVQMLPVEAANDEATTFDVTWETRLY